MHTASVLNPLHLPFSYDSCLEYLKVRQKVKATLPDPQKLFPQNLGEANLLENLAPSGI